MRLQKLVEGKDSNILEGFLIQNYFISQTDTQ